MSVRGRKKQPVFRVPSSASRTKRTYGLLRLDPASPKLARCLVDAQRSGPLADHHVGYQTPFACGQASRPLRIVIDDLTAPDCAATRLLYAFDGRSDAEVYGTACERPSRVVVGAPDDRGVISVEYRLPGGSGRQMAVMSSNDWIRVSARTTAAEFEVSMDEGVRSLTLAAACSRHEIDALVTASPVLALPYWRNLAEKAHAGGPEAAVALLGLYLRAHNDYTIEVEGSHATFLEDRRFYPAAAVAALPRYLTWLGDAVATWRTRGDPRPFGLAKGFRVRLGRALRARDYFNVRVRSPRPDDMWKKRCSSSRLRS